jgi:heat shock protein HslJ
MQFTKKETSALAGTAWLLTSIRQTTGRFTILNPENYTAEFGDNNDLAVKADCNTCGGAYTENAATGALTIPPMACTMIMCDENSLDGLFMSILAGVAIYAVTSDSLVCYAAGDTLIFCKQVSAAQKMQPDNFKKSFKQTDSVLIKNNSIVVTAFGGFAQTYARLYDMRGTFLGHSIARHGYSCTIDIKRIPAGTYLIQVGDGADLFFVRPVTIVR